MKLTLQYEKTIQDVKKEFNQAFPYLTIEFLPKYDKSGEPARLPDHITLGDINGILKEGAVIITPDNTAEEVERIFENKFSLPVQLLYRKANNSWTENFDHHATLSKQSEIARNSAPIVKSSQNGYSLLL